MEPAAGRGLPAGYNMDGEDGKVHEAEVEAKCAAATCLRSCRGRRGTEGGPRR